jgi:hypothetical protein
MSGLAIGSAIGEGEMVSEYDEWPVCAFCGTRAETAEIPITWLTSVENGRRRVYCDRCGREHLRSIESKLDSEWR